MKIEQYCKRRKDRKKPKRQKDSSCVLLTIFSRHLPTPRYRRKRKRAEVASAQARKKFCKSRQDDTAGKSSRERQAPALYAAVRVRRRSYGVSHIPDPSPGGSQDTGGAFRSRVQRPGVRHRSIGAGHICPMWQRTDLAQVKRGRHTGKPRKARSTKAFRLRQSTLSAEIRRKRPSLPAGEERHLNTTTITRTTSSPCIWHAMPVCVSMNASVWTPLWRSVRCVKTPSP